MLGIAARPLGARMSTVLQWVHLTAAVVGVGGIAFLLIILFPAARVVSPEQRDLLLKAVAGRFRWVTWTVVALLLGSGLYNVSLVWEAPKWGTYWTFLTVKIALALLIFLISLGLTLPLELFDPIRTRRKLWLSVAFTLALVVILISAYLRRGSF
jgi:uncharacterized membrane protein